MYLAMLSDTSKKISIFKLNQMFESLIPSSESFAPKVRVWIYCTTNTNLNHRSHTLWSPPDCHTSHSQKRGLIALILYSHYLYSIITRKEENQW